MSEIKKENERQRGREKAGGQKRKDQEVTISSAGDHGIRANFG